MVDQKPDLCDQDRTVVKSAASAADCEDVTDALIGTVLAERYEILDKLGSGGMGSVFRARHLHMDKLLAIKVLKAEQAETQAAKRFEAEAKTASTLTHPNLTVVRDYGFTEHNQPYIVMDLIDGITLDQVFNQNGIVHPDLAVSIFLQVCEGLEFAHAKGIVHRDLKPSNIMIANLDHSASTVLPGAVKIVDFGIAKLSAEEGQDLTKTGEICGSPYYMSPEQSLGQKIDARSDIYSLGCVIYQALTGKLPFQGDNAMQTLMKHVLEDPPLFREVDAKLVVPAGLEAITFKALQRQPEKRYQNISELKTDLAEVALGRKPKAKKQLKVSRALSHAARLCAMVATILFVMFMVRWWSSINYGFGYGITLLPWLSANNPTSSALIKQWIGIAEFRHQRPMELGLLQALLDRQTSDSVPFHETMMLKAHMYSGWKESAYNKDLARRIYADSYQWLSSESQRLKNLMEDASRHNALSAEEQFAAQSERVNEDAMECARQAFGEDDPRVSQAAFAAGDAEFVQKKNAEGEQHYRNMAAIADKNRRLTDEQKRQWRQQIEAAIKEREARP